MRPTWGAVLGGALVIAVGAVGLVRGEMPQSSVAAPSSTTGTISVVNAYIVAPVAPTRLAAGYFTVYNTTGQDDVLQSVETGAGGSAVLHTVVGGVMSADATGVTIPAHGMLTLSVGSGHVMIGQLIGTIKPGQQVAMQLQFENAGEINVTAPVIAVGQRPPGGSSASDTPASGQSSASPTPTASPTSAGAHS